MLVLCVVKDVEEDEGDDSLLIKASDEINMLPNRIY